MLFRSRSPMCWGEVGDAPMLGPEEVREMTEKVHLIRERMKTAQSRQKSYADQRRRPLEFEVGDMVFLKVSPMRGVVRFGKKGKLSPRFVGPFPIVERVGSLAYRLELPDSMTGIHSVFHMSMLRKCLRDPLDQIPLSEVEVREDLSDRKSVV